MAEKPNMTAQFKKLRCSKCGITIDAGCACDVAYVPAGEIVKEAIKLNPNLSNREIARNIGTSYETVRRERRKSVDTNVSTEQTRVGKDGKSYKAHKMPVLDPEQPIKKRAVTRRTATLEERIEKLERTYKRILEIRKRGAISHNLYRSIKALLLQPENVSAAKLQTLRVEWDIYGWLLAEKHQSTPSLTDVDISKEKVK